MENFVGELTCQTCDQKHDIIEEDRLTVHAVAEGWECANCGAVNQGTH